MKSMKNERWSLYRFLKYFIKLNIVTERTLITFKYAGNYLYLFKI